MSDTTDDEREAHYRAWLAQYGEPYAQQVLEAGAVPWFQNPARVAALGITATEPDDARRELFMRRYTRPAPPASMPAPASITQINRGEHRDDYRTAA